MAASTGNFLEVASNTPGGYTLQQHTTNTTTLDLIMQGNWDFVVLQEQSQRPSFPISQVEQEVFPYAEQLSNLVDEYNDCGETCFYMTWGRENGDAGNCAGWPPVCTYEGMDSLLRLRYEMMAEMNEAIVSPVSVVWRYLRENHPEIDLYTNDGSHPSETGTFAAACAFYTVFFRQNPEQPSILTNIDPTTMGIIQTAAKNLVFDNLEQWNVGAYDPISGFEFDELYQETVNFTNTSTFANNYLWDFGDGTTSTEINPQHTYAANGDYTVTLQANYCDKMSTFTSNITIDAYPSINNKIIDNNALQLIKQGNVINISLENCANCTYTIYDVKGVVAQSAYLTNQSINIDSLKAGFYLVSVSQKGQLMGSATFIK